MKDKIPTTIIEVGSGENIQRVEVYNWLTQDESDEYLIRIGFGDKEIVAGDNSIFTTTFSKAKEARNYRMNVALKSPKWDECTLWEPGLREELITKVGEILDKKK